MEKTVQKSIYGTFAAIMIVLAFLLLTLVGDIPTMAIPSVILMVLAVALLGVKTTYLYRDTDLYLKRITLCSLGIYTLKIHKIFIDDDEHLHDHPWDYHSFIIKGGYIEETIDPFSNRTVSTVYPALTLLKREAYKPHRIKLINNTPAISLILTKRVRNKSWGFFKGSTWVDHKEYFKQ